LIFEDRTVVRFDTLIMKNIIAGDHRDNAGNFERF
jgi:hypothetical protein